MTQLREIGRDMFGRAYIGPLAGALRADPYALRRWSAGGKTPANLSDRVVRMLRVLVRQHVGLALSAAEWLLKVQRQSDLADVALADRLRDLRDELEPKTAVVYGGSIEEVLDVQFNPASTLDDLLAGEPEWRRQQILEMEERAD